MRHLVSALITLGDYDEAEMAVKAYVEFVENPANIPKDRVENEKIEEGERWANKETVEEMLDVYMIGAQLALVESLNVLYYY